MMGSCQSSNMNKLSKNQVTQIENEIKQVATAHLNAKDAVTALSNYADNVTAVSNENLFASFEQLSKEIKDFYDVLNEIDLAVWDEMYVKVIDSENALFTGEFRYSFISNDNEKTNLKGVWTALYVRIGGKWKVRVRHESFVILE